VQLRGLALSEKPWLMTEFDWAWFVKVRIMQLNEIASSYSPRFSSCLCRRRLS
jgi:hypothetical protein